MSQTYMPIRPVAKAEDVQDAYNQHKDRLVNAIDSTKSILSDIRSFNKDDWVVRYPQLKEEPSTTAPNTPLRSLSFADDPSNVTPVRLGPTRSLSYSDAKEEEATDEIPPLSSDFHVLRLDLKLGSASSANTASSLVSQLEKSSIAHLLDERLANSIAHIDKLRLRVQDTSSKVLVTGDLNAGKSTLVNALLRRQIMPVDQQPCTTAFCEVHDATENGDVEAVHIVKAGAAYDPADDSTFTLAAIEDLEDIIAEYETKDAEHLLKVYLAGKDQNSLLSNGTVNISLIDAPGLNRDSIKTTALFARQEEIDVVVFVVSAENHFTLSAKEFLWTASNEKAYLFIVVNKYDMIRNKDKCKRIVLEQIKGLSPRTWEDSNDLVHFVDSASAVNDDKESFAFDEMEAALRSFVLTKRSKSKLQPVETFLLNLLGDIELLASANKLVAEAEVAQARAELAEAKPVLEKMKSGRDKLEEGLESVEEEGVGKTSTKAKKVLSDALEQVGSGRPFGSLQLPSYPGLLSVWDYARDVRRILLESLDLAVKLAEDEARTVTSDGVVQIKNLGEEHLPAGVERSRRIFMPEAMFSAVRRGKGSNGLKTRGKAVVVAGGAHGLGIGLASRPEMQETTFLDLFDVNHQFFLHFGDGSKSSSEADSTAGALSVVGVGVGALTMVGGQAVGVRGVIEGMVRLSDFFSNENARKWALPVVGAVTIGAVVYVILELPSSIPRTIGRRIKVSVEAEEDDHQWESENIARIGRETRKVLRLASWDLRERFRGAMEERGKEVKNAEENEKRALKAQEWFASVGERVGNVRVNARFGEVSAV
ncbi:Transmembrane GTPase [Mycena indigotica]|uniref:Transmembrane GTPase n=1 Tax=Mycena indigotica TaxID=2126181 RepID=A0A8H6T0G1_9AGAR|nr:Transmembrane GTPase [Mycena indigotica]KAF7309680.1 Transmembrane GTPase [Mycena indigotica]